MGFTKDGIKGTGLLLQGNSSNYPSVLIFASGSDAYDGTETALTGEILRKNITWSSTGIFSKYSVEISSLEGNGSDFNTAGLGDDISLGSGSLWTYNESFIGSKNNTFNVQSEGEIYIRIPVI
ncbi:MAG: hypothetical protein ACOCUI_05095 [bacterium]